MDAWYYRLPLAARVAITALLTVCVLIPMYMWLLSDVLPPVFTFGMAALVGLVIGVAVIVGERQIHRRFGSIEEYVGYRRALRTGELPADIDPSTWSEWLGWSSGKLKATWALAVAFVVFAIVSAPVLFGFLAAGYAVQGFVLRRWIDRLAAQIEQRARQTEARDHLDGSANPRDSVG